MNISQAIEKLNEIELNEFALRHARGLLNYDGNTAAPKDSRIPRGKTMGIISRQAHNYSLSPEVTSVMDALHEHYDELDAETKRRVDIRDKQFKEIKNVPVDVAVEFTQIRNDTHFAWLEAKEKSDYSIFAPHLEKMIAMTKRYAEYVSPEKKPYEYCLDKYEEGLTEKKCEDFFSALRAGIVPLIDKVKDAEQPEQDFSNFHFPVEQQKKLSDRLMEIVGIDRSRCAIGETEHPFTTGFSKYDVRITTNYHENSFLSSMYSVIHESGHAMYNLHYADRYNFTSLGGGASMGIHESQSRFYENIIGRSRSFIEYIYPDLVKLCPELSAYTAWDIYRAANKSTPSLVRIHSDELTYSMHIMVRYEIEKAFMNGSVPVAELPDMWNSLYRKYLGIDVTNDRDGILQDSHWSNGQIGYFPSYSLGSAYGAQLLNRMSGTLDVPSLVARGEIAPISAWLEEHIWQYGMLYKPAELIENAMGGSLDPKYYLDYLESKVKDVYGV